MIARQVDCPFGDIVTSFDLKMSILITGIYKGIIEADIIEALGQVNVQKNEIEKIRISED